MKEVKCSSCGAKLAIEKSNDKVVCPYCGTQYVDENKTTTTNQIKQPIKTAPPRPKINEGLAILLCLLWVWPGIIYIAIKLYQQYEWDNKYKK